MKALVDNARPNVCPLLHTPALFLARRIAEWPIDGLAVLPASSCGAVSFPAVGGYVECMKLTASPTLAADSDELAETTNLPDRLAFLQISDVDRERLRAIAPILNACSERFVEGFYRHLFAFAETAKFLQDPELVERLKRTQQAHLESMLEDEIDEAYVARRRRVGDVHAQVGISPQMFLGAYNQYLQYGLRQLTANRDVALDEFVEEVLSLLKAIFLDVELTLDAYFAQATANLRQALDMLFRANTLLRQFAQLTSHDLKTPLATVANLCDETLDEFGEQMPQEACRLIEMAKQRTFRMSTMIDELLQQSAPIDDFQANGPVDLRQTVAEVIERLGPEIESAKVAVAVPDNLPSVWGNRVRLREAIFNILSNAVKFADKDPAKVTISVESHGENCQLAIADNGPGIPAEDLDRIFSAFRRLKLHQDKPGTGLGLYFAKSLIEQDGGRIWAESQPGDGSTFYLALKRHR